MSSEQLEAERARFESAHKVITGYKAVRKGDGYEELAGDKAWKFWQAARSQPADDKCDRCGASSEHEAETRCIPDGDSCPGCEKPLSDVWSQPAAPRVVSDERTDTLHQLAFEIGDTDEAGTGYSFSMEQFDEFSHAVLASVQRDDELPEGYGPPEGYELTEHLPGIWQYEYQESGKEMVSLTSWNTPILACIAAWKDKLAAVEEKRAALESIAPLSPGCAHSWHMQDTNPPTDRCTDCGIVRDSKSHVFLSPQPAQQEPIGFRHRYSMPDDGWTGWIYTESVPSFHPSEKLGVTYQLEKLYTSPQPAQPSVPVDDLSERERLALRHLKEALRGFEVETVHSPLMPPATYLEKVTLSCEFQPGQGHIVAENIRSLLAGDLQPEESE